MSAILPSLKHDKWNFLEQQIVCKNELVCTYQNLMASAKKLPSHPIHTPSGYSCASLLLPSNCLPRPRKGYSVIVSMHSQWDTIAYVSPTKALLNYPSLRLTQSSNSEMPRSMLLTPVACGRHLRVDTSYTRYKLFPKAHLNCGNYS